MSSWTIDSTNGRATNPDKPFFALRKSGLWRWFTNGREVEYPSQDDMDAVFGGPGVAAGTVIASLRETAPTGYLALDGATVVGGAATYPNLAAACPWMVSGSDLVLPDARGRFLRGFDDGAGVDPDAASRTARAGDGATGDEVGTYQADAFQGHRHSSSPTITGTQGGLGLGGTSSGGEVQVSVGDPTTDGTHGAPLTSFETRPKNLAVLYCVKT